HPSGAPAGAMVRRGGRLVRGRRCQTGSGDLPDVSVAARCGTAPRALRRRSNRECRGCRETRHPHVPLRGRRRRVASRAIGSIAFSLEMSDVNDDRERPTLVLLPAMLCDDALYRPQIERLRDLVEPMTLTLA